MTAAESTDAPQPRRNADLGARLATAAVGIPILLVVIMAGGALFTAVVASLLGIAAWEVAHAAGLHPRDPLALSGVAASATMAVLADVHPDGRLGLLVVLVMVALTIVVLRAEVPGGFARWSAVVGGTVYAGLLGSTMVSLRQMDDGRSWFLLMLFSTFAADTGAFFTGRALGRHKLAPHVSPGKTIEGLAGGILATAVCATGLGLLLDIDGPGWAFTVLGLVIAVAATFGDLAESLMKRALGVKDMGHLFPGHGGVLDRMDSVLFVAPMVYYAASQVVPRL